MWRKIIFFVSQKTAIETLSLAAAGKGFSIEYLKRKRKERLFKQWVNQAELPPEEVPSELLGGHPAKEAGLAGDGLGEGLPEYAAMADIDRGIVRLPLRYVLIGLSVVALLLVVLSVLITVLIMRS